MTNDRNWQPCEPGTIQKMADEQLKSEQSATITRRTVLMSTVGVAGALCVALLRQQPAVAELTCYETRGMARAYVRGKLPATDVAAVEAHLSRCSHCTTYLRKLEARQATT